MNANAYTKYAISFGQKWAIFTNIRPMFGLLLQLVFWLWLNVVVDSSVFFSVIC